MRISLLGRRNIEKCWQWYADPSWLKVENLWMKFMRSRFETLFGISGGGRRPIGEHNNSCIDTVSTVRSKRAWSMRFSFPRVSADFGHLSEIRLDFGQSARLMQKAFPSIQLDFGQLPENKFEQGGPFPSSHTVGIRTIVRSSARMRTSSISGIRPNGNLRISFQF
jgi:hypothetical protein